MLLKERCMLWDEGKGYGGILYVIEGKRCVAEGIGCVTKAYVLLEVREALLRKMGVLR